MRKLRNYIISIIIVMIVIGLFMFAISKSFDINIAAMAIVYGLCFLVLIITFIFVAKWRRDAERYSSVQPEASVDDAISLANVGILVYNENHEITWVSSFFAEHNLGVSGQRLLGWIPDLDDLMNGDIEQVVVIIADKKYEVTKKEDASVLFFKDITENYDLKQKINDEAVVFGLVNFDNLDDLSRDDEEISTISNDLKLPVLEYLKKYGVAYKTLRNHRIFLILNESIYQSLAEGRFSILNTVRKLAKQLEVPVTLSLAFARGTSDLKELDELASSLLELAQTRGGDQVAVRKVGEDVVYYGGTSEAKEKSSRVQVRVMTNTIKDLINRSSNVIIVGHLQADADCVASAICMADIARSLKKEACVVLKTGGIEKRIQDALDQYKDNFDERHHIVSINEAMNQLRDDSLVIMVDHHSANQSNGKELLKVAKRIIIIDHHRRMADLDTNPILTYIEASASSTCELVMEFVPYLMGRVSITPIEASLMYLGVLIDTNRFRVRTGVRTFEVLKNLRQYGADLNIVETFNEEPYDLVLKRSKLIEGSYRYRDDIIIAKGDENQSYPRSIISQAGDMMLQTIGVNAVFVIANFTKEDIAISARSKGDFNVQVIMEKMDGGGHMTAAGLQVKDQSISDLEETLKKCIDEYLKEKTDESHTAN